MPFASHQQPAYPGTAPGTRRRPATDAEQGLALLLVLLLIALLSTLTLRLIGITRAQRVDSAIYAIQVRLDAELLSGLNLALPLLHTNRRPLAADTLLDPWARLSGRELQQLLGREGIVLTIQDLSGRLQVNALVGRQTQQAARVRHEARQRELWQRLLTSGRFGAMTRDEVAALLDALTDWIDGDDEPRPAGAESDWYRGGAQGGYSCRNGALTSIEELLLVRGMTAELLHGTDGRPGLADSITVNGSDGRININTAPPEVLLALGLDAGQVRAMIDFRGDEANRARLMSPGWPSQVHAALPDDLVTIRSTAFLVRIETAEGIFQRFGEAVIQREASGEPLVLSWYLR